MLKSGRSQDLQYSILAIVKSKLLKLESSRLLTSNMLFVLLYQALHHPVEGGLDQRI